MTTAQERRRARRLARSAVQGLASAADADVVVAPPTATGVPERASEPQTPVVAAAVDAPGVDAPGVDAPANVVNDRHRWTAVRPAPRVTHARAPGDRATSGDGPKRWVAVKPQGATGSGAAPVLAPPPADALEARPRPAGDAGDTNGARSSRGHVDDGAVPPPPARALHPRTRAIRITRVKTNGRRRWSVDFLMRQPDPSQDRA